MPYRICKTFDIESGHMLSKHPKDCKFPHGHSRKVEVVLEADVLDDNDMVCDFGVIKLALGDYLSSLDHAMCVNTDDPRYDDLKEMYGEKVIGFECTDPTTEVLAKTIYGKLNERLVNFQRPGETPYTMGKNVNVISIKVWETGTSWAEFSVASPEIVHE